MAVTNLRHHYKLGLLLTWLLCSATQAAILPEDRSDVLYHSYEGGGVTISGPSVLVRKGFKDTVSVYANYYVDMVSSASIDVITSGASRYTEERTQYSAGADYLYDKTILSLSYTTSIENDYEADTVGFGVSQSFFGDMTTVSVGYSQGDDIVMKNGDDTFAQDKQTKRFKLSFSQILTRDWIISSNLESVIDQGYLNNPYRQARYLDAAAPKGFSPVSEVYPTTRNSDAASIRSLYYLPYRAAIKAEVRTFADSWGIRAYNGELGYIHPHQEQWLFEAKVRYYTQDQASFYSDLYDGGEGTRDFFARDKEMSKYATINYGLGATYEFHEDQLPLFDGGSINLFVDYMLFEYENFRDIRSGDGIPAYSPGQEPLYSFDATVIRLFVAFTY